jgi:hypothetical protein
MKGSKSIVSFFPWLVKQATRAAALSFAAAPYSSAMMPTSTSSARLWRMHIQAVHCFSTIAVPCIFQGRATARHLLATSTH